MSRAACQAQLACPRMCIRHGRSRGSLTNPLGGCERSDGRRAPPGPTHTWVVGSWVKPRLRLAFTLSKIWGVRNRGVRKEGGSGSILKARIPSRRRDAATCSPFPGLPIICKNPRNSAEGGVESIQLTGSLWRLLENSKDALPTQPTRSMKMREKRRLSLSWAKA